jgi:hypothetical protein
MQAKTILIGSVVVNLALVGALALRPKPVPPPQSAPGSGDSNRAVIAQKSRAPVVIKERDSFQWHQIETADFEQYIANLRAIGCPEETIRDLVIAEVNKLFAPKFATLAAQTHQFAYWKPNSKKPREALQKQLDVLRAEKRDLIKTLLGVDGDPNEQWVKVTAEELVEQGKFGFLSPEKQAAIRQILEKYRLSDMSESGNKKQREQRRQELGQVLTPDELYQFDLRDSNTSQSVRSRFGAADLTEDEYKKLFDLRKAYEDQVGAIADNSDPEKMRQRGERRSQLEQEYADALGEQRMKEVQREQDPQWRALNQVAQQHGLDQQTLMRAYDYQQIASEQVAKLFGDPNLPRENRRAAMDQINAELQRNLAAVMGETAYNEFRKAGPGFYFSTGRDTLTISGLGAGPGEVMFRDRVVQPAPR